MEISEKDVAFEFANLIRAGVIKINHQKLMELARARIKMFTIAECKAALLKSKHPYHQILAQGLFQ